MDSAKKIFNTISFQIQKNELSGDVAASLNIKKLFKQIIFNYKIKGFS